MMLVKPNPNRRGSATASMAYIPPGTIGIEIGVWEGDSTALFASVAKHVYAVDSWSVEPYVKQQQGHEHGSFENYAKRYKQLVGTENIEDFQSYYNEVYMRVVDRFKDKTNVSVCRMTSSDFFKSFASKVDWVYVDGNHGYQGCYEDLENARRAIKNKGLILGDDYPNKPGVKKAVDEFIAKYNAPHKFYGGNQYKIRVEGL